MIRKVEDSDREELVSIINGIGLFNDEEKAVAIELIDESLKDETNYYQTFVILHEGKTVAGYYCIGKRALTDGVYDLYWIVVGTGFQSHGYGNALLQHAESYAANAGGRLLLAETSSKQSYKQTRSFYKKNHYEELATIRDFYSINDNLIVYGKYINTERGN